MIPAAARRRTARVGITSALVAGAVASLACGTPAWGATGTDLPSTVATRSAPGSIVSDVTWTLPASARSGDSLRLSLPEHPAGVLRDGPVVAHSGVIVGVAALDTDGQLTLVLNDAADDPGNRTGEAIVTTTETTTPGAPESFSFPAAGRLGADDVPGAFHGIADRSLANKYGLWIESEPATVRWTIETPRGPWDVITVADAAPAGQSFDCTAGVSVRSTTRTDPGTGYLIDLERVPDERVSVTCGESELRVDVTAVGDGEIVEVAFDGLVEGGIRDVENTATVTGTRIGAPTVIRHTTLESLVAPRPVPSETTTPPLPTETTPPMPDRLAATGGSPAVATAGVTLAALCALLGAAALGIARRGRHRRSGA